jgi:tetratricopeptide (TPR) repeat protein
VVTATPASDLVSGNNTMGRQPAHPNGEFNRRILMTLKWNKVLVTGMFAASTLLMAGIVAGQNPPPASAQNPPPASSTDKTKTPENNSLTLDDPNAAPVTAEEDTAYKALVDSPSSDQPKRIELGEAFLQKYPNSRYRSSVYNALTMAYLQSGQVQKMEEVGEKELTLNPNDVQTMAVLAQTLPRAMNSKTPEPEKVLAKAEGYSRKAIELTPTLPKPTNVSDDSFSAVKSQTLAMAHGGLGLVYIRRGNFKDAIPELNQSVTLDPTPDPVNYYLLGMANAKTSHFDDSTMAYNKCAAIAGAMQDTCKKDAEETKKLAATQLSAPK